MLDPVRITKTDRTPHELEVFLLFAVAVAGKTAHTVAPKVNALAKHVGEPLFSKIRAMEKQERLELLKHFRLGKYNTLMKFLDTPWDGTMTTESLERLPGVGPKTSRFFLMHSLPNPTPMAALDTHILKYLRSHGIPKLRAIKKHIKDLKKSLIADFDLMIWNSLTRA